MGTKAKAGNSQGGPEAAPGGGLARSSGGTGVSELISESEVMSKALSVVGRLKSTRSSAKAG